MTAPSTPAATLAALAASPHVAAYLERNAPELWKRVRDGATAGPGLTISASAAGKSRQGDADENGARPAAPTLRGMPAGENGFTKREALAGRLLAGMLGGPDAAELDHGGAAPRVLSQAALRYADALLLELAR